jgi:predicted NAD/FAD-dependent oxidoreductase
LAEGREVRREAQVARVRRSEVGWELGFTENLPNLYTEQLVVTAPVPQALALLSGDELDPAALARAERIRYAPCFALMAGFAAEAGAPPWPALRLEQDGVLAWIANDASKRPQPHPTTLVLHATPAWTRANVERDPAEVTAALLAASSVYWPAAETPSWTRLHRWRYAQPEVSEPAPHLRLAPGLWLAGDAFGEAAGRIEGAFESGRAVAAALLSGAQPPGTGLHG